MDLATDKNVREAFKRAGHAHVFRYWDELNPQSKFRLLSEAQAIDLDEINKLVAEHVLTDSLSGLSEDKLDELEPAPYIQHPSKGGDVLRWEKAAKAGELAIRAGKVAAFCVAGGQGTRLGFNGPKGTFPVTPLTKKSLFQVFAEKIKRSSERYETVIHWFVLTSEINHAATAEYFELNNYFGLPRESVHLIVQGLISAVDQKGKIILTAKDSIARTPDGHGGSLRALARSSAIEKMKTLGVECISYFQVDNPLIRIIDPAFIGFHLEEDSELSSKMIPKAYPLEKVGHFCTQGGKTVVVEYSDMSESMQKATNSAGDLHYISGSVAIHLFDRDFIARVGGGEGQAKLPFHRANKRIPFLDAAGNLQNPDEPNGVKFEMFVFDALPLARNAIIIESLRADDFSPVKNSTGVDSPKSCAEDLLRSYARWLIAAGVNIEVDSSGLPVINFEISYSFAADQEDFLKQWNALSNKPDIVDGLVIESGI
jgi:UDP-N-acetylglucosamine/UDP-N-acetylgalactosamine diphosphorylase